jgi:hypothetical protein
MASEDVPSGVQIASEMAARNVQSIRTAACDFHPIDMTPNMHGNDHHRSPQLERPDDDVGGHSEAEEEHLPFTA